MTKKKEDHGGHYMVYSMKEYDISSLECVYIESLKVHPPVP